jgi:hypothetical protein
MSDCCSKYVNAEGWPTCWTEVLFPTLPLLWKEEAALAGMNFALQLHHHSKKQWFKESSSRIGDQLGGSGLVGSLRIAAAVGFQKIAGLKPSAGIPNDPIAQCPLRQFGAGFAKQLHGVAQAEEAVAPLGQPWSDLFSPIGWNPEDAAEWAVEGVGHYFAKKNLLFDKEELWHALASSFESVLSDRDPDAFWGLPGEQYPIREKNFLSYLTKEKQLEMQTRIEHSRQLSRTKTYPCSPDISL